MKYGIFVNHEKMIQRYKTYLKQLRRTIKAVKELNIYTLDKLGSKTAVRTCPICHGKPYDFGFLAPIYDFVKCPKCNFFYARELYDEDTLNQFYRDDIHNQEIQQIQYDIIKKEVETHKLIPDSFIKRCIKNQTGTDKCLDIGCGFGVNLSFLKPHFKTIEGIELDKFAIEKGREMFGNDIKIYQKELKCLKLKENSYDLILLNQVIEHISDLDMFKTIHKLLKPKGILCIATPTSDSLSFRMFQGDWVHVHELGHIQLFNDASFKAFAKQFNFKITHIQTNNWLDIQLNDVICRKRKGFVHRFNDVPYINPINLGISIITKSILNTTNLLSKLNNGCYVEVIMKKDDG